MTTGTAKLRRHNEVTPAEWQLLEEEGYVRLGVVQRQKSTDFASALTRLCGVQFATQE